MKLDQRKIIKTIDTWLKDHMIKHFVINDDLTINVNGDVNLSFTRMEEFPTFIQFNKVNGSFDCSENRMTTLRGCPRIVTGNFYCYNNRLSSLQNCPEVVKGKFFCHGNNRKFLEGDAALRCDMNYFYG